MAQPAPIPEPMFPPGARVRHRLFGEGTVMAGAGRQVQVRFDDYGPMLLPPALLGLEESRKVGPAPRLLDRRRWNEVLVALQQEARIAAKPTACEVRQVVKDGPLYRVEVGAEGLEDSLEGARAWWPEPGKGAAELVALRAEEGVLYLRNPSAPPPGAGRTLYLYPPEFYQKLLGLWQDEEWAAQALEFLAAVENGHNPEVGRTVEEGGYPWLRAAQRRAFELPRFRYGRLHGPPGTGKTTTVGALLAGYLRQRPEARVLLVSTTNLAVDQALLAADRLWDGGAERPKAQRIGLNFEAGLYARREHLLPDHCGPLLDELTTLEARGAATSDPHGYTAWKDDLARVRSKLRAKSLAALKRARLAAMTVARALTGIADLKDLAPYDLLVFDEASQVSLAHALALAPLAKSVLFAGDPQQLAPVFRAGTNEAARQWLGRTAFDLAEDEESTVFLDEQSRMAPPISELISRTFYGGRLRVAEGALRDAGWQAERAGARAEVRRVEGVALWSPAYGGLTRWSSAEAILALLPELLRETAAERIAVVTPFRAQRALLQSQIRLRNLPAVLVTTAHGVQGGERHTVVFDPVDGAGRFLRDQAMAARLVNVALSRAQARLYLYLSEFDLKNPVLRALEPRMRRAAVG